jgi:hypothetical protein
LYAALSGHDPPHIRLLRLFEKMRDWGLIEGAGAVGADLTE